MTSSRVYHDPEPTVVGLVGRAGVGKDHMASVLRDAYGYFPLALADHLKVDLIARGEVVFEDAYGQTRPEHARTRMQLYGTEEIKPRYGEDYWVRCLEAWMRVLRSRSPMIEGFVVPDVRFQCEAAWVRRIGGLLIRLEGEGRGDLTATQRRHRSETETETIRAHVTIDNRRERWAEAAREIVRVVGGPWPTETEEDG